jgi:penicillin-binding protein-related factor A (putative recombinase)
MTIKQLRKIIDEEKNQLEISQMPKEQQLQSKILKYLKEKGIYAIKTVTATKNGVPDIIACYKGKYIAIEVKTPEGKLSELQHYNLRQVEKAGGYSFVVRSVEELKGLTLFNT